MKLVTQSFEDGKFNLKSNKHEYKDVITLHDQANDGDTYDFSPLRGDREVKLDWNGEIKAYAANDNQKLVLKGEWVLPYDLEDRNNDSGRTKKVQYILELSLNSSSKAVSGKLTVENTVLSHRLRLALNTGIESKFVHAQIQGGFRNTENLPINDNWNDEFVEKPVNIYIFDKSVGIQDNERGLYFLAKGEKEYEKIGNSVFITLMATTGELGKPNLIWRPGRASGDTTSVGHTMTPTPMAQELGKNVFEFGLEAFDSKDLNDANIAHSVYEWLSPSVSYQMQKYNLFVNRLDNKIWDIEFPDNLPEITENESWLNLDLPCEVSAIYPAYSVKDHYVLRLSNMSDKDVAVDQLKDQGYIQTNALEDNIEQSFIIEPYSMATFIKQID